MSVKATTPPLCDYCFGELTPGTRTTHYASDVDYCSSDESRLTLQRHYCESCSRKDIAEPCEGVFEVVISHKLTNDYCITELELESLSDHSEGVPWNPEEVLSEILGVPPVVLGSEVSQEVGPESVVDALAFFGLSLDMVIRSGGGLSSPEIIEKAKEQVSTVQEHLSGIPNDEITQWLSEQSYPPDGTVKLP